VSGVSLCGRVQHLSTVDGRELFKVQTDVGPRWVTGSNVRLCSGTDGLCTCAEGCAW
jgi:hypothetical protein